MQYVTLPRQSQAARDWELTWIRECWLRYPKPDCLIDRIKLAGRFPPRVRAKELWRVAPEWLEQAWNDATLLAIRDQERAGLEIITDGEMRRESYSNRFATAHDYTTVNGVMAKGGSLGDPGPAIVGGMLYVGSGFIGTGNGMPGNVLLAFSPE